MNDYKELIENFEQAIEQLVKERDDEREATDEWQQRYFELARKCSQLEKERDAAVADLADQQACYHCKYARNLLYHEPCKSCMSGGRRSNFEWLGVRGDNDEID